MPGWRSAVRAGFAAAGLAVFAWPGTASAVDTVSTGFDSFADGEVITTQLPGVTFTQSPVVFTPPSGRTASPPRALRHPALLLRQHLLQRRLPAGDPLRPAGEDGLAEDRRRPCRLLRVRLSAGAARRLRLGGQHRQGLRLRLHPVLQRSDADRDQDRQAVLDRRRRVHDRPRRPLCRQGRRRRRGLRDSPHRADRRSLGDDALGGGAAAASAASRPRPPTRDHEPAEGARRRTPAGIRLRQRHRTGRRGCLLPDRQRPRRISGDCPDAAFLRPGTSPTPTSSGTCWSET